MIRLFIGLELSQNQKQTLHGLMEGVSTVKWQRDDQLHLTLAYIGEVPRNVARDIAAGLEDIHFNAFDLTVSGVGIFGSLDKPRCLWAGAADHRPLQHLRDKIEHVLNGLGVDYDKRKYKPHITLTRVRKRLKPFAIESWLAINDGFTAPTFEVNHFTIFTSQLSRSGSYYTPEERFTAGGGIGVAAIPDDSFGENFVLE